MSEINRLVYDVTAKDAVWPMLPVIMADLQTGEILYAGHSVSEVFGYDDGELLGKTLEILVPDMIREAHASWRKDVRVPKTRLMGVGRLIYGKRKSGDLFPVHVGLTEVNVIGRSVGVAFVIDLTAAMETAKAADSGRNLGR